MKIHASHILLAHLYEAEDLVKKLQQGESFESLAQKFSQCSSSRAGGNLGVIDSRRLDDDFVEAYEGLKKGEISSPIKTKFGFHLIRREID